VPEIGSVYRIQIIAVSFFVTASQTLLLTKQNNGKVQDVWHL
jgi:hypothetical protein